MKHVLAMVKPYPDLKGHQAAKIELDYIRLIHIVGEMRKQGENAQGYFIIIGDGIPKRMSRWERDYEGKRCVELISTLPTSYIGYSVENEKTSNLSGMVTAAILETPRVSNSNVRHKIEDLIMSATILALEPGVQRIKEDSRFPFGFRWDYYGVVELPDTNRAY